MDLKAAIEHQTELLVYLRADMYFIKECKDRAALNDTTLSFRYISVIRQLALNDCFIKFYKLVHHSEQHCISRILNEAAKQGFGSVDGFSELIKLRIEITNLFKKNSLYNIRNEHIAHSDLNRDTYTYTWNELFLLSDLLSDFYKKIKFIVTGQNTYFTDDAVLAEVIVVTEKYASIVRQNSKRNNN